MSSPNRNILSDIFCIGVFFLCHLPVCLYCFPSPESLLIPFLTLYPFPPLALYQNCSFHCQASTCCQQAVHKLPGHGSCHGLSGGTVASLHYRETVKIIQFLSGNDQLGRIHVNRIVPFSVDLDLAGWRKVCSLDIIGVIHLRHNLNGIQRGIIDSHTHLCPLKKDSLRHMYTAFRREDRTAWSPDPPDNFWVFLLA